MAAVTIPKADAEEICALKKTAEAGLWHPGSTPGSMAMTMGVVCAPPRRGLQIAIYMHRGYKVLRRTIDFSLWDVSSGVQELVYQLTIADSSSPTHIEKGVQWFGSHEHMGDVPTQHPQWDAVSFPEALAIFSEIINLQIVDGEIDDPTEFKLVA